MMSVRMTSPGRCSLNQVKQLAAQFVLATVARHIVAQSLFTLLQPSSAQPMACGHIALKMRSGCCMAVGR